jgi:hypothetical protein
VVAEEDDEGGADAVPTINADNGRGKARARA